MFKWIKDFHVYLSKPLTNNFMVGISGQHCRMSYHVHFAGDCRTWVRIDIADHFYYVSGLRIKYPLFKKMTQQPGFIIGRLAITFPDKHFLHSPLKIELTSRRLYNWMLKKYGTGI